MLLVVEVVSVKSRPLSVGRYLGEENHDALSSAAFETRGALLLLIGP
jgi:hypothetical protein